jgi:hypothetical protein
MSSPTTSTESPSFISRVLASDPFRKGVAGALAGALVAVISEAVWGSTAPR